jgi:16S rRNA (guanine1207-N2)-methyltransferase
VDDLRIAHALATGQLELPASGPILLIGPRADASLAALPAARLRIVTGFRPDHDAFSARGLKVFAELPELAAAAALVVVPRARAAARAMIAAVSVPGRLVVVEGAKTDGIDALLRDVRGRLPVEGALSKAHGRVFWFRGDAVFEDWALAGQPSEKDGWVTSPGVFSSEGPDPGSVLLAERLPPLKGMVADLGAGWGYLSRGLLAASPGIAELHLIEAEHEALACARLNVTDPRARFHWADATRPLPGPRYDAIVMNPPFHVGRAADPALGRAFIASAQGGLKPSGQLWLVANRHLPYEAALSGAFAEVETVAATASYKILRAARPRRSV